MNKMAKENNIIYGDINYLTIDENDLTRMEITNDGRHLDNFKRTKVLQGIILSELIKSAKETKDRAYKIDDREMLVIPTKNVYN